MYIEAGWNCVWFGSEVKVVVTENRITLVHSISLVIFDKQIANLKDGWLVKIAFGAGPTKVKIIVVKNRKTCPINNLIIL